MSKKENNPLAHFQCRRIFKSLERYAWQDQISTVYLRNYDVWSWPLKNKKVNDWNMFAKIHNLFLANII